MWPSPFLGTLDWGSLRHWTGELWTTRLGSAGTTGLGSFVTTRQGSCHSKGRPAQPQSIIHVLGHGTADFFLTGISQLMESSSPLQKHTFKLCHRSRTQGSYFPKTLLHSPQVCGHSARGQIICAHGRRKLLLDPSVELVLFCHGCWKEGISRSVDLIACRKHNTDT